MAMVFEELSQKTIVATSSEEVDKLCNKFKEENTVRFTQSNQVCVSTTIYFINTLFYLPKEKPKVPEIKKVLDEKDARWGTCLICGGRWKWSHFPRCQMGHGIEGLPAEAHDKYKEMWGK